MSVMTVRGWPEGPGTGLQVRALAAARNVGLEPEPTSSRSNGGVLLGERVLGSKRRIRPWRLIESRAR